MIIEATSVFILWVLITTGLSSVSLRYWKLEQCTYREFQKARKNLANESLINTPITPTLRTTVLCEGRKLTFDLPYLSKR